MPKNTPLITPITYRVLVCTEITDACRDAVQIACLESTPVVFTFNGIRLQANPKDKPKDLVELYHKKYQAKQVRNVSLTLSKREAKVLRTGIYVALDRGDFRDKEDEARLKKIICLLDQKLS